jgi:hypothetical protein
MGAKTLGFRMVEYTIPLGQKLYLLGDAYREGSKIKFSKSKDSKKPSVLSTKSETDIIKGNKTKVNLALIFGIIAIAGGILVMIFVH